jgi:ribose 5-phosphate isomerase B
MKLILGADHAGFSAKEHLKRYLGDTAEVVDVGTFNSDQANYPDFTIKAVKQVLEAPENLGILVCGSGIGVSMAANKFSGVRAALCRSAKEAALSVQHNNANILCLGSRINSLSELEAIVDAWLKACFEGGRHAARLSLFEDLGEKI